MKIRLKDSYNGPIPKPVPKDVLYDAIRVKDGYCIADHQGRAWSIHKDSVEEVDEFEEEFNRLCAIRQDGSISFPSGEVRLDGNWVVSDTSSLVRKEHIPNLILALLKLMDE